MERLSVGGVRLEFVAQGTGEPVVFIHGAFIADTFRLLLAWLPRAEEVVLPGTTHFMQLQDPGGLTVALASFFARHPLPLAA